MEAMNKGWMKWLDPPIQGPSVGSGAVRRRREVAQGGSWVANLGAGGIVWDLDGESDLGGIVCVEPPPSSPALGTLHPCCLSIEA